MTTDQLITKKTLFDEEGRCVQTDMDGYKLWVSSAIRSATTGPEISDVTQLYANLVSYRKIYTVSVYRLAMSWNIPWQIVAGFIDRCKLNALIRKVFNGFTDDRIIYTYYYEIVVVNDEATLFLETDTHLKEHVYDYLEEKDKAREHRLRMSGVKAKQQNVIITDQVKSLGSSLSLANAKLEAMEAQLAAARQEIERLNAGGQGKPPKTAGACEAAQTSRVEEWKGYAAVMVKVAYQCGVADRTDVLRPEFEKMAAKHGGLSSTALDLLRDALPEVAKKTPGAPKQG